MEAEQVFIQEPWEIQEVTKIKYPKQYFKKGKIT